MSVQIEKALDTLAYLNGFDGSRAEKLQAGYGRAVLHRISEAGGPDDPDLQMLKSSFDDVLSSSRRGWRPGFGAANALARRGPDGLAAAKLQLFLTLSETGTDGEIEATLPCPERLRVRDGTVPLSGKVRIESREGLITAATQTDTIILDLSQTEKACSGKPSGEAPWRLVWGYGVDPEVLNLGDLALEANEEGVGAIENAARLLSLGPDGSIAWTHKAIDRLSLLGSDVNRRLSSRSTVSRPGDVTIAVPGGELHLAELLVHESAHQHFNLAALFGPIMTAEAISIRQYSAINGLNRPLDRVALAWHAVRNMIAYLEAVADRANGSISDAATERLSELAIMDDSLRAAVEANWGGFTKNAHVILERLFRPPMTSRDSAVEFA